MVHEVWCIVSERLRTNCVNFEWVVLAVLVVLGAVLDVLSWSALNCHFVIRASFYTNTIIQNLSGLRVIPFFNLVDNFGIWNFWPIQKWIISCIWRITTPIAVTIPPNQHLIRVSFCPSINRAGYHGGQASDPNRNEPPVCDWPFHHKADFLLLINTTEFRFRFILRLPKFKIKEI